MAEVNVIELTPLAVRPEKAMELLSIGRDAFYGLVRAGRIRTVKVDRATLVPVSSIREFLGEKPSPAPQS